jgi:hypothetical protein
MDNLFIDRNTRETRVFAASTRISLVNVTEKRTLCTVMLHPRGSELVDFGRGDTGGDERGSFVKDSAGDGASGTHDFEVPLGFEILTQGIEAAT